MTRPTTTGKAQDLITFTRSTTGTYLDSVVYGDELVTNGDFSNGTAGWSSGNLSTLTVVNEALVVTGVGGAYPSAKQVISIESGKKYILAGQLARTSGTILARAEINQPAWLAMFDTNSTTLVDFAVEFTAVSNSLDLRFTLMSGVVSSSNSLTVDNVSVKEVIGGQGTQGTSLLRTSAIDEARIEYDASGNCLGLLVEEARTNKATYSQDFTHDSWNTSAVAVGAAPIAAPDGTMTANHVVKTGSNGHLSKNLVGTTSDRVSVWARTVSGTGTMYLGYQSVSHEVTVTEEWQRFDAQLNNANAYVANFRGAATLTEVYLWGAQVETGSFPTSYIPTSGSTVTRAADIASLAVSEFGYNQDQGTVVIDWNTLGYSTVNNSGVLYGGASNARWIYSNINNTIHFSYDGTNSIVHGSIPAGQQTKLAMSVDSSTQQSSINGNAIASASHNGNIASNTSVFNIGHNQNAADLLTGHIKSIQYYPLRLSNAQLQALTV